MRLMFHQPVVEFIRESKVDSSARCKTRELILPSGLGNQASLYIRADSPLPILQMDPFSIKSLDHSIPFHVKEGAFPFCGKNVGHSASRVLFSI